MDKDALRALVEVVELGSFVAASRRLGLARPTLRRRLDELEAEVGVQLLVRTRAGSVPTDAGQLLAKRGRDLLRDEAATLSAVREMAEQPRGELVLVIPVGMAPPPMAGLMVAMRQHYPKLTVRIRTTEDPIGSLERGVDAAMAIGVREPEGRWKSIEVARVERRLVASPSYLERTGVPDSVETLAERDLLTWDAPDGSGNRLPIVSGGSLEVQPIVESPDIHLVRQLTAHGLGIAFTPDAGLPEPGLPLVPVMPDVVRDEVPVRIIVAAANEDRPRIRALLTEIYGLIAKLNPEMVKR